jgi:hypothetical protein
MGFGGGPEPLVGWIGVAITSRRSSMSNFAAMSFPASEMLKCGIHSTSAIINGFSNNDYGFLDVSVEFCIPLPYGKLAFFGLTRLEGWSGRSEQRPAPPFPTLTVQ